MLIYCPKTIIVHHDYQKYNDRKQDVFMLFFFFALKLLFIKLTVIGFSRKYVIYTLSKFRKIHLEPAFPELFARHRTNSQDETTYEEPKGGFNEILCHIHV